MEHILNLGTGEGVFHLHEINVEDHSPVLFASVQVSIFTDPLQKDIDIEKQAHIQHQCALMRRELKSYYLIYINPCFDETHLGVADIYRFKQFLKRISSGEYPDMRLTQEGIRVLGAINAKIDRQIKDEMKETNDPDKYSDNYNRVRSKYPSVVHRNVPLISVDSCSSGEISSLILKLVPKSIFQEQ